MSFDDLVTVTIKGEEYRINFQTMTKNEAVYRVKNADLSQKVDNYDYKKLFIIVILINKPKIITRQQRFHHRNRDQKKVEGIMKKIKKGYKRWLVIHIKYYLKKKKIEKENRQDR